MLFTDLRLSDTAMYTCRAVSETGETSWSAALIVEAPSNPSIIFHRTPEPSTFPGAPSKPIVSDITATSVRLTWRPNTNTGASPIHSYTVEYFSHDTGEVAVSFRQLYSVTIMTIFTNTRVVRLQINLCRHIETEFSISDRQIL